MCTGDSVGKILIVTQACPLIREYPPKIINKTTKMVLNSRLEGTGIASDLTSAGWTEGEEEDSLATALTTFSSTFCSWLELFSQSASLET